MQERDHIGLDPVAWVDRLLEVARGSDFDVYEKAIIEHHLSELRAELNSYRRTNASQAR